MGISKGDLSACEAGRPAAGVVFDLDGVLVATDGLHAEAWRVVAQEQGIELDPTWADRCRGLDRMSSLDIVLEGAKRSYSVEEKRALADRKNECYRGMLKDLSPADVGHGVVDLLIALRGRGVKLAVASSSRNARMILERTGLTERFDAVVDGDDVERPKPDPGGFLLAAKRLKLDARRCVVVEDAAAGVQAARAAGMAVFGIGSAERLAGADGLAARLGDVDTDALLGVGLSDR